MSVFLVSKCTTTRVRRERHEELNLGLNIMNKQDSLDIQNSIIQKLNIISDQLLSGKRKIKTDIDNIDSIEDEGIKSLARKVQAIIKQYMDCYEFMVDLSCGRLNTETPRNAFANPFKELHGELRHLTWQIQQIADGDYNQSVSFSGDFSDAINKMIVVLRERHELANLIKETEKFKTAFLSNISHEIRTPLNAIIGYISLIEPGVTPYEQLAEYIDVIKDNSNRLLKQMEDIIDIAKIEVGELQFHYSPVHINNLMHRLVKIYKDYLGNCNKSHINLILDESNFIEPCVTITDSFRLCQVLENLLENAIKFTENGTISFGYCHKTVSDEIEFFVEDSGVGLSHEQLEFVFSRFNQADFTSTRKYGGTGIGLSISRGVVKLMGGEIQITSVKGKGSRFYFTIPYKPVDDVKPQSNYR